MNISNQAPAAARSALGRLQQSVINPVVRLAWDLGLPIPGDALLETTGRRTGLRRRTPVCDGLDGQRFWLIAQRGRDADWVRNIEHNPRVRVKVSGLHAFWRAGTAHILDDDDPRERQRILSQASFPRRLCMFTSKAQNTNPLTIRVDLDNQLPPNGSVTSPHPAPRIASLTRPPWGHTPTRHAPPTWAQRGGGA